MLDGILKNLNLFIDGYGYAGNVEELNLPKLTMKTDDFRNGGMDLPIEVELGMEKLESSFSLTKFDAGMLKIFGLAPGNLKPFTFRGSLASDDGTETGVIVNLRGMLKEADPGSWKPGEKATLKGAIALRYYKLTIGNEVIHEIDGPNMIRIVNGVDQLAVTRKNLGM